MSIVEDRPVIGRRFGAYLCVDETVRMRGNERVFVLRCPCGDFIEAVLSEVRHSLFCAHGKTVRQIEDEDEDPKTFVQVTCKLPRRVVERMRERGGPWKRCIAAVMRESLLREFGP